MKSKIDKLNIDWSKFHDAHDCSKRFRNESDKVMDHIDLICLMWGADVALGLVSAIAKDLEAEIEEYKKKPHVRSISFLNEPNKSG